MSYKPITAGIQYAPIPTSQFGLEKACLKVIVAVAEDATRLELNRILRDDANVRFVAEAVDGFDALEKIASLRPNLIFLDIDLPGLSGFDVVSNLNYHPAIVFISTSPQHAIRAFEENALDFLLTPIPVNQVAITLSRARAALASERNMVPPPQLPISRAAASRGLSVPRLAVHKGKRVLLLNLKDIYYIKIESKLVFTFTADDQYLINRTIMELDKLLPGGDFFQINRATIINLNYLLEIIPWFSGTCRLKLVNGIELPLSRARAAALKALVGLPKKWSGK